MKVEFETIETRLKIIHINKEISTLIPIIESVEGVNYTQRTGQKYSAIISIGKLFDVDEVLENIKKELNQY